MTEPVQNATGRDVQEIAITIGGRRVRCLANAETRAYYAEIERAERQALERLAKNPSPLWLDPVPPLLRERAIKAFDKGDAVGVPHQGVQRALNLVDMNAKAMRERGIYEEALLHAFSATRTNNCGWPTSRLEQLFAYGDPARLRAAGEPLPGPGPFVLYRGVAGARYRHVRGLSWTSSIMVARWFADRFVDLPDRAIYTVSVGAEHVIAYLHEEKGRSESEFIVRLPKGLQPKLLERRDGVEPLPSATP